jgi:hypothetical protein
LHEDAKKPSLTKSFAAVFLVSLQKCKIFLGFKRRYEASLPPFFTTSDYGTKNNSISRTEIKKRAMAMLFTLQNVNLITGNLFIGGNNGV